MRGVVLITVLRFVHFLGLLLSHLRILCTLILYRSGYRLVRIWADDATHSTSAWSGSAVLYLSQHLQITRRVVTHMQGEANEGLCSR
jgi:hypothetical protein